MPRARGGRAAAAPDEEVVDRNSTVYKVFKQCNHLSLAGTLALLGGIGCMIAGGVIYATTTDEQLQQQVSAFNTANAVWMSPVGTQSATAFQAKGAFLVQGDFTVSTAFTSAIIEPASVPDAAGSDPYTRRAAFTTNDTLFSLGAITPSSNVQKSIALRDASGNLVWTRVLTVAGPVISPTAQRCSSHTSGGRASGCTDYCPVGDMNGLNCYSYLFPNSAGLCIAVDPVTLAYVGGCAITSPNAAKAPDVSNTQPSMITDISQDQRPLSSTPASLTWGNFSVTIRSASDPWYIALKATQGYMQYGLADMARKQLGLTIIYVGIGLFLAGVFFAAFAVCLAYKVTLPCCRSSLSSSTPSAGGSTAKLTETGPSATYMTIGDAESGHPSGAPAQYAGDSSQSGSSKGASATG